MEGGARLAPAADLHRAATWGAALRFAARLSGSSATVIGRTALEVDGDRLVLRLPATLAPLYGDAVEDAHRTLGETLGLKPQVTHDSAARRWFGG